MRVMTVMSGMIISATGAWCLAYYRSAFSSIAFVLAIAMTLSAVFLIGAYLVSGKKRLPETVLVEGMLTLMFGFVTLNNEVADTAISMFFGAWLATAGLIRFSQGLAVSRFDAKNWAKILPLSILSAIFGLIMLMHSLVASANQLTLVGGALILNGLSQLVYALYMVRHENLPQAEQAKRRVEAKQALAEAKRKERDELRQLSRSEREIRKRELRDAAAACAEEKKRQGKINKEKQRAAREALLDPTVQLSTEDMAMIAGAIRENEAPLPEETAEAMADPEPDRRSPQTEDRAPEPSPEPEPTSFVREEPLPESAEPILSWDNLPKEPAWETAAFPKKADITEILEREVKRPEAIPLTPLSLADLIEQEQEKETPRSDRRKEEEDRRFTEEFSWHWPPKDE